MDPIQSAAAFSNAQSILEWVLQDLSVASPRTFFLGCIYRSHPALEMGLSAGVCNGQLVDVSGLHQAFAQSPTFFDRWLVESRQRNRWQDYTRIDIPVPLTDFWKLKTFNSFRRVVICQGSRPLAYISATLSPGSTWTSEELKAISRRYRRTVDVLRLTALAWRAKHSPEDRSTALMKDKRAVVVLGENGAILSCSPEARRWLPRDQELKELVERVGKSRVAPRTERLRRYEVNCSDESNAQRTQWKVIRLSPVRDVVPTRLHDALQSHLSPRELELSEWLVMGHTNASIAAAMGVRPSTVKTMLERLYERHGAQGRVGLVKQLVSGFRVTDKSG